MKAKNQQPYTSELDAKEKLIVYVYEYLIHSGAKQAADTFKENIGYTKEIKINEGPGFLNDWWCVFWDLYCAAPDRRINQPESSGDARAFHDLMTKSNQSMSPSITQTSPPQHPQQPPGPPPHQFMGGGPRYGPPPGQPRGPPPRMQGPPPGPPQHGPHPGAPPGFMPAGSPRYAQHPGPPPPQPHMNQGPMFGPGPDQMGPSPGLNRMTPVGGPPPPPQQVVGPPPPNGPPGPPQMVGMPGGPQMGGPGQGQAPQGMQPPRNGSQGSAAGGGWQGNVNYNVNSPANHQMGYNGPGSNQPPPPQQGGPTTMMMSDGSMMEVKSSPVNGAEMSAGHGGDEYVMPVPFGQDTGDQCESAEIMQIKKSMQEETNPHAKGMFDKEQDFGLSDYDPQNKWQ